MPKTRPKFRAVTPALPIDAYEALERLADAADLSVAGAAETLLVGWLMPAAPAAAPADETARAPKPRPEPLPEPPAGRPEPMAAIAPAQVATAERLWASRFTTADIARLLNVTEASVAKALQVTR